MNCEKSYVSEMKNPFTGKQQRDQNYVEKSILLSWNPDFNFVSSAVVPDRIKYRILSFD